ELGSLPLQVLLGRPGPAREFEDDELGVLGVALGLGQLELGQPHLVGGRFLLPTFRGLGFHPGDLDVAGEGGTREENRRGQGGQDLHGFFSRREGLNSRNSSRGAGDVGDRSQNHAGRGHRRVFAAARAPRSNGNSQWDGPYPGAFFGLSAAPGGPLADPLSRFFARDRSGPIVLNGMLSVELISS